MKQLKMQTARVRLGGWLLLVDDACLIDEM